MEISYFHSKQLFYHASFSFLQHLVGASWGHDRAGIPDADIMRSPSYINQCGRSSGDNLLKATWLGRVRTNIYCSCFQLWNVSSRPWRY